MNFEPYEQEIKITNFVFHTPFKLIYKKFSKNLCLVGNEKVLDFGSGYGTVAYYVSQMLKNGNLTCVDVSKKWINTCRNTLKRFSNVSYFCGDIYYSNLEKKSFDVVYSHFVLHDIENEELEKIIPFIRQLMKDKGRFVICEPLEDRDKIDFINKLCTRAGFTVESGLEAKVPAMGRCKIYLFHAKTDS